MKNKKSNATQRVLSVAALLSMPLLPSTLYAQVAKETVGRTAVRTNPNINSFIKLSNVAVTNQTMSLVGVLKGEPLFRNGKNELFIIDTKTGDMKMIPENEYADIQNFYKQALSLKNANAQKQTESRKHVTTVKWQAALNQIKIIGIDKDGHVIQETAKGEKFYLDAETGDMIDFAGHLAFLK